MTDASEMTLGEDVFHQLQRIAHAAGSEAAKPAPTGEYLTRHGLESFLDRLARTPHAQDFVLKGGILLAAYGVRRPTKDVDAEAVNASETVVAEKGVTILERGITSTRWRDYVDIVRLAQEHGLNQDLLLQAAQAVARYRQVTLGPIGAVVTGYGALGQPKWAAWRRKEGLEDMSEESLDDQMVKVAGVLDPVFGRTSTTEVTGR